MPDLTAPESNPRLLAPTAMSFITQLTAGHISEWLHRKFPLCFSAMWLATLLTNALAQTWANYGPRVKSGPLVLLFWPAGIYTNLNFHRKLSGRPFFFPLEITDGSDFQKNKPQRYKIGIKNEKNEVKIFYYGNHIRTRTVIFKKKGLHLVFQSACGPRLQQFFQIWPFM